MTAEQIEVLRRRIAEYGPHDMAAPAEPWVLPRLLEERKRLLHELKLARGTMTVAGWIIPGSIDNTIAFAEGAPTLPVGGAS